MVLLSPAALTDPGLTRGETDGLNLSVVAQVSRNGGADGGEHVLRNALARLLEPGNLGFQRRESLVQRLDDEFIVLTNLVLPSAFFAQQGMTPCFLAGRD